MKPLLYIIVLLSLAPAAHSAVAERLPSIGKAFIVALEKNFVENLGASTAKIDKEGARVESKDRVGVQINFLVRDTTRYALTFEATIDGKKQNCRAQVAKAMTRRIEPKPGHPYKFVDPEFRIWGLSCGEPAPTVKNGDYVAVKVDSKFISENPDPMNGCPGSARRIPHKSQATKVVKCKNSVSPRMIMCLTQFEGGTFTISEAFNIAKDGEAEKLTLAGLYHKHSGRNASSFGQLFNENTGQATSFTTSTGHIKRLNHENLYEIFTYNKYRNKLYVTDDRYTSWMDPHKFKRATYNCEKIQDAIFF